MFSSRHDELMSMNQDFFKSLSSLDDDCPDEGQIFLPQHIKKTSTSIEIEDTNERKGVSDQAMWDFAMKDQNILQEFLKNCKSNCDGAILGRCCRHVSCDEVGSLREFFWGNDPKSVPTRELRRQRMIEILRNAYNNCSKCFIFTVGKRAVCELGYLRLIGLITSASKNRPDSWSDAKKHVTGVSTSFSSTHSVLSSTVLADKPKTEHAIVFIEYLADLFAEPGYFDCGELSPDVVDNPELLLLSEGETVNKTDKVKYLPYDHSTEVFVEYKNYYKVEEENLHPQEKLTCGVTTFRAALASLNETIKLRSCRGGFDTCSICNQLNDLLKNTKLKWSQDQLEIVLKLKRLHLQQQAAERRSSKLNKMKAKTSYSGKNPIYAYFEADAYTEFKCLTPRMWQFRSVKGDTKRMGNRVIGIIVVCGPIETRFVYSLDDLVYGGANTMIEVMRQAFHDLAVLLSNFPDGGLLMPKNIFCQFDNCGENKNKYMLSYMTLLVERGHFDVININFLLVGHTHSLIDQYFSVLTNKLWDTAFVGSPMALQNLFFQCENPQVNRQIWVHYDYKSWLDVIVNKKIKYLSLPHCFLITREHGVGILQHKPFSTSTDWLPLKPQGVKAAANKENLVETAASTKIQIEPLGLLGGFNTVYQELVGVVNRQSLIVDKALNKKVSQFSEMYDNILEVETNAAVESINQSNFESEVGYVNTYSISDACKESVILATESSFSNTTSSSSSSSSSRNVIDLSKESEEATPTNRYERFKPNKDQLKLYQDELAKAGTLTTGYLMMLDYRDVPLEWFQSSPNVYNYINLEGIISQVNEEVSTSDVVNTDSAKPIASKRKNKESIASKIATKVAACQKMVRDINNNQYEILTDVVYNQITRKEELRPFSFKKKALLQKEVNFFRQNSTPNGVLQTLNYHVQEASKQTYELFPVIHFSEIQLQDQKSRQDSLEKVNKETEDRIRYVLGSKYSNSYYNNESNTTSNVLPHAQQRLLPQCEVKDCSSREGIKKCNKKDCGRFLCKTHFPTGGHPNHKDFIFKQSTTSIELIADSFDTTDVTNRVCQVLECNEISKHRCSYAECRFMFVCNLHGNDHEKHANQIHKDDEENRKKRLRSIE